MWARIKRIFKSILGWFISMGESPELILEQNIRDMQDQIPAMNENLALVQAQVVMTEKSRSALKVREQELSNKIKAALQAGKRDVALNFATTLEEVRKELVSADKQYEVAKQALEKAQKVKRAFLLTIEQKTQAAKKALDGKRQAEWQAKIADAMASFRVAGIDATHDEMVRKMEEEAAVSAGKLEAALSDLPDVDIEQEAANIQANETLRQFELQMGMAHDINAAPETTQEQDDFNRLKEFSS